MATEGPTNDDRLLFTRDELVAAFSLIAERSSAVEWADEILEPVPADAREHHTHLGDDVLDLLSLVSDDCAKRVAELFGLTPELAEARRREFRLKLTRAR